MTYGLFMVLLHATPALDRWRRWRAAAARLLEDAARVRERLRRERAITREDVERVSAPIHYVPDPRPGDPTTNDRARVTCATCLRKLDRAGGEMACVAGDPAALDEEERALFKPAGPLHYFIAWRWCGADSGPFTDDRAAFTTSRNRCPECYRRLFPAVDA